MRIRQVEHESHIEEMSNAHKTSIGNPEGRAHFGN
jgi:hypothetical protein